MRNITFVTVKSQFEGIHCYPEAPDEVSFLREFHRHMFHVELEIEVFSNDRELEFIMVKRRLEEFTSVLLTLGRMSCEMIAEDIQDHFKKLYPISKSVNPFGTVLDREFRIIHVRVLEDNENGVYLRDLGGFK